MDTGKINQPATKQFTFVHKTIVYFIGQLFLLTEHDIWIDIGRYQVPLFAYTAILQYCSTNIPQHTSATNCYIQIQSAIDISVCYR